MATLSIRDAARQAGVSRSSILRAIQSGRMSAPRKDDGGYAIDPAELFRVFEPKPRPEPLTGPAGAEDGDGRYHLSPTPDGYLKLDSHSGAVSECTRGPSGYQCRLVPDEQAALQAEIDRLAKENAALREQLAKADAPLPERPGE